MFGGKALGWMAGTLVWMPGAPGKRSLLPPPPLFYYIPDPPPRPPQISARSPQQPAPTSPFWQSPVTSSSPMSPTSLSPKTTSSAPAALGLGKTPPGLSSLTPPNRHRQFNAAAPKAWRPYSQPQPIPTYSGSIIIPSPPKGPVWRSVDDRPPSRPNGLPRGATISESPRGRGAN